MLGVLGEQGDLTLLNCNGRLFYVSWGNANLEV